MSAATSAPEPGLAQCGWCPVILADDPVVILLHFAEDHGVTNGNYSVCYIQGDDWDVTELTRSQP